MTKQHITWEKVIEDLYSLAEKIPLTDYKQIIVIGLGGMCPAYFLAKLLGITNVSLVVFSSYVDTVSGKLRMKSPMPTPSKNKDILIVDDLVDTGKTVEKVKESFPNASVVTLYKKPYSPSPDYYVEEIDGWIIFPWEITRS